VLEAHHRRGDLDAALALKLLGGETDNSIVLFEETAPAGTDFTGTETRYNPGGRWIFRGTAGAAGRVGQRTGGQRDAAPAWLGDRWSAAFLTSGSVKSNQVLRRSARDELLRLSRLADTHSADEFRDQISAAHGELIDIVQPSAVEV
jgi:hypothetical protein